MAQGATQKVEDLQKQYDIQNTALDKVRKTLDSEQAATDVVGATEQRMEEREVYQYLAQIGVSLAAKQTADARKTCDEMLSEAELQVVKLMKGADGAPVETEYTRDE